MTNPDRRYLRKSLALFALAFGLLTIFSGGTVLFGGEQARAAVGDYVPFVLWFNFLSGFAYVAAGAGIYAGRRWAAALSVAIAFALIAVSGAFVVHVAAGAPFEMRTVGALAFRTVLWIGIAALACPRLSCLRAQAAAR